MVVRKDAAKRRPAARRARKPKRELTLAERIAAIGAKIPADERAGMPRDGAANHDHYIYGTSKQY